MNNLKVSKKDVKKSFAEKEIKREAQAKHNEVMRTFDSGIAAYERDAKQAFSEAKNAYVEGRKDIYTNYIKIYAFSKKQVDNFKLKKAEYSCVKALRDGVELAKQIGDATNAALLALGCPKPEKVFAEHLKNEKKFKQYSDAYSVIMDGIQESTQNMTADLDDATLAAAEDEVKTAIDLERANKLSDSVFPDIKTNDFSTEELLMAIEEKNKEE